MLPSFIRNQSKIILFMSFFVFTNVANAWTLVGEEVLENDPYSRSYVFQVDNTDEVYQEIKVEFLRGGAEITDVYLYVNGGFRWPIPTLIGNYENFFSRTAPLGTRANVEEIRIVVGRLNSPMAPVLRVYLR